MTDKIIELSDGTLRQRRNLLLTSILLILMHHAEISLGASLSFQGLSLSIGNPSAIHNFLFILLAYFLWRFYQCFNSDKAYLYLRQQYNEEKARYLARAIKKSVTKRTDMASFEGSYQYTELKKIDKNTYEFVAQNAKGPGYENKPIAVKIPIREIEISKPINTLLFAFRGRILTDFFAPYLVAFYAAYLQFV